MSLRKMACLVLVVGAIGSAHAQIYVDPADDYAKHLRAAQEVSALKEQAFGDKVSLYNGSTQFGAVDISVPGNFKLPVQLGRQFSIEGRNNLTSRNLGGFGEWDIDVPYIEGTFTAGLGWKVNTANGFDRCSNPAVPNVSVNTAWQPHYEKIWNGNFLHIPGQGDEEMLVNNAAKLPAMTDGVSRPWVTKSWYRVGCLSSTKNGYPGEAFVALAPDGTKYTFDWVVIRDASPARLYATVGAGGAVTYQTATRSRIYMLATKVEDRFGNSVRYTYQNDQLTRIDGYSSDGNPDGRYIALTYTNGVITQAASNLGTWNYTYLTDTSTPYYNGLSLKEVMRPDNSKWTYGFSGSLKLPPPPKDDNSYSGVHCQIETEQKIGSFTYVVTSPSGAAVSYLFNYARHYRNYVPYTCTDTNVLHNYPATFNFFDNFTLVSKDLSGIGVAAQHWAYSYGTGLTGNYFTPDSTASTAYVNGTFLPPGTCSNCSLSKFVIVSGPASIKKYEFGVQYARNEGRLLSVRTTDLAGNVLETTSTSYMTEADANAAAFPAIAGGTLLPLHANPMGARVRPVINTSTVRDGVTTTLAVNSFDAFSRDLSSTSSSSLGYTKAITTLYFDDLAKWVIGQVAKKSVVNANVNNDPLALTTLTVEETTYNTLDLPYQSYKFGRLQQALTYNPDGTVATATDGNGNVTTLSNWKRGIPGFVRYPATTESPAGATQSADIDDRGWILSVTDEVGAKTCYSYDALGRVSGVTYPSETQAGVCDTSRWSAVSMEFVRIDVAEHGLPAGHWRSHRVEGNKHVNAYYDALWRPVLEESLDAGDASGTVSQVVKRYDAAGRQNFQSYPQRGVDSYLDVLQGTRTTYDALDRVTRVEQDSESGVLATTTEYLSGLKTKVTNPRGFATTTSFMVWDQPTYDFPIRSEQPENKVVEIVRHPQFGWPLQLTQRSVDSTLQMTRKYVYDGNAQLCKTIEPETGVAVMGYDGAGNMTWQAQGLNASAYGSTTDCQYTAAFGTGLAATREYDPRNRLFKLNFPGGRGNQIWTYEKDNLPASVTAYNDPNNTTPVVTAYTYNKRRLITGESLSQPGWYTWGVGYDYDSIGNLRWQSYPTGLVLDYAPNALGQATQARDTLNRTYASGATYYPNGALKQFTYGNGIVHTMTQNVRQLPTRVTSSGGVTDFGYTYDSNGNVASIWDYARDTGNGFYGRWMTYDGQDRLTSAGSCTFGGDCWHRFTYDALDNIKSWKLAGVKDYADYVYDQNNRLTSIRNTAGATVVGIGYDAQGNLQNKNGQGYEFDYGNRLRAVSGKEYYRYDGLGRRVLAWEPTSNSILSMYTQSGQMVYEENYRTSIAKEHIYFAGSLIASRERSWVANTNATKYQHTDALGSPVAVTNEAGAVIGRNDYEPYGAIIGKPTYSGIGYTGHVMDGATGLTYMQQRYYDQSIGRFLSVDPVQADAKSGANFSRYKYANNNPYRFVDPDGRQDINSTVKHDAQLLGKAGIRTPDWRSIGARAPGVVPTVLSSTSSSGAADRSGAVQNSVTRDNYAGDPSDGEKLQAIRLVGVLNAVTAKSRADDALGAAEQSGLPGLHNGPADAFRHCTWSCEMRKEIGIRDAQLIGDNHEAWGGNPAGETQMDLFNNRAGRDLGALPQSCAISCADAVRDGVLRLSPVDGEGQ